MQKYSPIELEKKWQKIWEETEIYQTPVDPKNPYYCLVMFPYPSGNLHVGHWYNFALADSLARYKKMQGYDLLSPIGFDSFGLPAENAAIKRGLAADQWTADNISQMKVQLKSIGAIYDWDRTLSTSDPEYYHWTQWLFLQFYQSGQAYQSEALVNWDPVDQTVLANEQVVDGRGERSGALVEKKRLKQWFFRITDYADELLDQLDNLDWHDNIKQMQRNWIGKSQGSQLGFAVKGKDLMIEVFTTRIDTLAGATFLVLAPEHDLVEKIVEDQYRAKVKDYQKQVASMTNLDRIQSDNKDGVFTGAYAVNPLTNQRMPVYIAEYVLPEYGTGAIMAVPAHDQRDHQFATKHGLEIIEVIDSGGAGVEEQAYEDEGLLINSERFNGLAKEEAKRAITQYLADTNRAKLVTNYRLKDWLISRQRYWGCPIPIIYCDKCGVVPVPEEDLPVILPLEQEFDNAADSPLKRHPDYLKLNCPACGDSNARRETDTLDTFVDSSWYFLRYTDNHNSQQPFNQDKVNQWMPVGHYIGGIEHAVMHLLYARYFTKALADLGLLEFREPFKRLTNQGTILGPDGQKMSKSKGNVVDPDQYVSQYGSDSVRTYLMFLGPFSQGGPWDDSRFEGITRFLTRLYSLVVDPYEPGDFEADQEMEMVQKLHATIKKLGQDLEELKFNTAVASLMELVSLMQDKKNQGVISNDVWHQSLKYLSLILAPITPHLAEEFWQHLGEEQSVHLQGWPAYDPEVIEQTELTIPIQINGKKRSEILVAQGLDREEVTRLVLDNARVQQLLEGREPDKIIVVPDRIVNIVLD
ncbi:leucine--tRNA ligase [Candidatus Nomurabacteria bacterium]|nr:leucine--tRNA ligase [Candidatus Nomurabacteria bacterium]